MSLDFTRIATDFSRAANSYDGAAVVQREVADRLLTRFDYINVEPQTIVDLGCGTGYLSRAMAQRFRKAQVIGVDIAAGMCAVAHAQRGWFSRQRYICADVHNLPLATQSVDLVVSNFMLHWATDIKAIILEIARVLKPDGLLLFSTLGPDTYRELRQSFAAVDDLPHVHPFTDMHDLGDGLLQAQLRDPVMDTERLVVTYDSVMTIMRDLKAIGAQNIMQKRQRSLYGKNKFQQMLAHYEQWRCDDGTYPVTFEVVYGHAWGNTLPSTETNGEVSIPISSIKRK